MGIDLDLTHVPRREPGMTPYELMLSESQERMLMVAKAGKEEECIRICRKWDLDVAVVGRVTGDGILRVRDQGKVVAEIPAKALADDGPSYERPYSPPAYQDMLTNLNYDSLPDVKDANAALLTLLGVPTIASKRWVYEQYDHMVRTNTMVRPGSDAAVVRIKGTNKAVAMTVDCNGRYCLLHPYEGARHCGGRGGAQSGLLRRRADRTDGLSEFRQSRAARHHVAVRSGDRRAQGCLRAFQSSDRQRQCEFLQRNQRSLHLSDADARDGRTDRCRPIGP